jgi:hypothetical protein
MAIWTAGGKHSPFIQDLDLPKKDGWILVDSRLFAKGNVLAMGDSSQGGDRRQARPRARPGAGGRAGRRPDERCFRGIGLQYRMHWSSVKENIIL